MLEGNSDFTTPTNSLLGMGQLLFNPEDAKGWDWGVAWINTGTVFARASLANTLCTNRGVTGTRFDPNLILAGRDASTAAKVVDIVAERINVTDVAPDMRSAWIDYMNRNDDGTCGTGPTRRPTWTRKVGPRP